MSITAITSFETLFSCPITTCLMEDPRVIKQCGHIFEASVLQQWLGEHSTCPLCRKEVGIAAAMVPYQLIRDAIEIVKNEKLLQRDSAQPVFLQDSEAQKILKDAVCAMNQIRSLSLTWAERLTEVKQCVLNMATTAKQHSVAISAHIKETCCRGDQFPFE